MRRFDEPGEKCPLVILKSSDHDNWRMCRDSSGFQMAGLLTVNNLNWGSFYLPLFEKAVNHSANFCYRNQHVANGSFEGIADKRHFECRALSMTGSRHTAAHRNVATLKCEWVATFRRVGAAGLKCAWVAMFVRIRTIDRYWAAETR